MNYITQDMVIQLFSSFSRWGRDMERDPFWGVTGVYRLSDEVCREVDICLEQVKQWRFEASIGESQMADSGVESLIRIHLENAERVLRAVASLYLRVRNSSADWCAVDSLGCKLSRASNKLHSYRTGNLTPPIPFYPHKHCTVFTEYSLSEFRNKQLGEPWIVSSGNLPVKCSDCHIYPYINASIGAMCSHWYRLYCDLCKCGTRRFSNQQSATEAWNRMQQ